MGKRKSGEIQPEERGFRKESLLTVRGSEDEGDEGSGDLSGSEEEKVDEQQVSHETFYEGDDDADAGNEGEARGGDEEEEHRQDADGSTAFGRAFGKIMKKRVPQSAITQISGPVLAERKQLLVTKFEEAEIEGRAKVSGKEEKREVREMGHVLPQTYTDAKEKALIKLATKGVVRLFNAVSKAQKVQADADFSSSKAAKATWEQSKAAFNLGLIAGSGTGLSGDPGDEIPGQQDGKEVQPAWAALQTDFMLGSSKKLIDWDKNLADSAP